MIVFLYISYIIIVFWVTSMVVRPKRNVVWKYLSFVVGFTFSFFILFVIQAIEFIYQLEKML